MKELPLSLLSRGCGQLVPLTEGGHDGRLEVCFEPEDFFSWRAQPLLLHLSRSGHLLGGVGDPTPPKTYSTRKGHLILYSEDLVSSSSQSVANRKGRGSKQEADLQLHTLRDLTGAILSYRSKQPKEGSTTGPAHPLLSHLTHASHTHLSSVRRPPLDRLAQLTERFDEGYSSGQQPPTPALPPQVPYRPHFLCSPRPSHAPREPLPPITEGLLSQRVEGGGYLQKGRVTLETGSFWPPLRSGDEGGARVQSEADTPSAPMILCCSQEPEAQEEPLGRLSEETNESALQHGMGCAEHAGHHGKCSLKRASVDSSWKSSCLSHISFYGGHMVGSQRANSGQYARLGRMGLRGCGEEGVVSDSSFSILRLPTLPRGPLRHDSSSMTKPSGSVPHLPSIPEGASLTKTHTAGTPAQRPGTPVSNLTHTPQRPGTPVSNLTHTLQRPGTPGSNLTHTPERPKMAASRETPAAGGRNTQGRRMLFLIPRPTREEEEEEEEERPAGVIQGIPTEEKAKERGNTTEEREKDREKKAKERGKTTEEREKNREMMDNDTRAKRKEGDDDDDEREKDEEVRKTDDDCGESGERGAPGRLRGPGQQEQQEQPLTLVGLKHTHLILLEPQEGAALPPSLGTLPPLTGRRGPGKQSSMAAYRHNPHEPPESSQSQPSIVRGSIPVELRDWQKGSGWGTLVMGPDGDIIRLSLWDPSGEHQLSLDDVTEEHAVRILVSEGEQEGQPWTILLEPESTAAEEDLSGKAEVTSGTRETSHVRMKRVARVGVHGDDINAEGRCGSGTDDGAPADGQIQSPERSPGVRGAVSGDQPVSTAGGDAERKEGSERRREMDRAEKKEDAPPGAGGDSEAPPQLTEEHRSHRRSPRAAHSAAETPLDTSIPQCPSGVRPEPAESHAKAVGISQTARDVEREGRGRGEKGGKGGRKERKRGEVEHSGGQERREAQQRQQTGEEGIWKEGGLQEEEEQEDEEEEERRRTAEEEKVAPTASALRNREGKTKEEKKKGTKERDGASKAQKAAGKRGRKARVKGQNEFVVGKPRPKQEEDRSERKSPEEHEQVEEQHEEEEEQHEEEEQPQGGAMTGDMDDTMEHPLSEQQGSPSSSLSRRSDCRGTPVSQGQSSWQANSPEEAPPWSPPPMSLHPLTSRSASTVTDSHVTKPSQSEESAHVNNNRNAEEVARQRERQAAARAEKAEHRRQEVERKRREREEEKKRQMEREEREERMKLELEEEQKRRAEEARLRRQREEEERQRREGEELERRRREEAERERERRRQEEKRRQMERLQRLRQEEENHRAEEQERLRLEEEQRQEEERRRLQEMEESERREYLQRLQEEEEERGRVETERKRREEEARLWAEEQARLQAELMARQRALLEQRLRFRRGLLQEAGGLEQSQDISRPWVFSYFTLLQLLGISDHTPCPEGPGKATGLDSPGLTSP